MAEKLGPLLLGHGEMAVALAKALRIPIDTDHIQGFELRVFAGQVATLRVTHFVDEKQAGDLAKTFSTFRFGLEENEE